MGSSLPCVDFSSCSFRALECSGRRQWHPTPVLLPGKSHGRRSLVGYSPWGREGSDTTEQLHFHFSLSCIGEGNGDPLQCSCLENPRDRGAWWASIYGVAQSRTRLKQLSSSSSKVLRFSSCSTWAKLSCGMWDLSSLARNGTESPAWEDVFLTTGPPGKSLVILSIGDIGWQ